MLRFLADENFKGAIYRGLVRRQPPVDVVRVQDLDLAHADDPKILELAAQDGRVVLTHDYRTLPHHAYERVRASLPMPGVCVVIRRGLSIRKAIEEICMVAECSLEGELENQVRYLPL